MGKRHSNRGEVCELCAEKISTAHPILGNWWVSIKEEFPDAHISWAFRDEQSQEDAYLNGNSRVKWPNSKHNKMKDDKPCSRALDLFRLRDDNVAEFNPKWYYQIHTFLVKENAPIVWGGAWKQFKDACHFELEASVL